MLSSIRLFLISVDRLCFTTNRSPNDIVSLVVRELDILHWSIVLRWMDPRFISIYAIVFLTWGAFILDLLQRFLRSARPVDWFLLSWSVLGTTLSI